MTASAAIDRHDAKADPLEVFRARCEARATLCANGLMDLQTAVDQLQEVAVAQRLVATHGQDAVQEIMAESFARWRYG
jgi:predicted RNA-binding Zn ribbon-like protein